MVYYLFAWTFYHKRMQKLWVIYDSFQISLNTLKINKIWESYTFLQMIPSYFKTKILAPNVPWGVNNVPWSLKG